METATPTYIIGDVHGQLKKLQKLLHDMHLVDEHHTWSGQQATLWFIGDLVDRGPDSIGVLDMVMRLQREADVAGGQVACLLGNHELMLLAAYRFGRRSTGLSSSFISRWKQNGGNKKDLALLTTEHLTWLANLPLMALAADRLLVHADAPFYLSYGPTVEESNARVRALLKKSDDLTWEELIEDFARRGVFAGSQHGADYARRYLATFGGQQVIHGHTPITAFTRAHARTVTGPLIYAEAQCVDVDGGMFLGGPGFVYEVPQTPE
jgi:diadenosine tetraphosphatase ApaH/serine/threonine PP2A family protein phosphatase